MRFREAFLVACFALLTPTIFAYSNGRIINSGSEEYDFLRGRSPKSPLLTPESGTQKEPTPIKKITLPQNTLRYQHRRRRLSLSIQDMASGTLSAQDLVTKLLGAGVTASNITFTGHPSAAGTFSGGTGIIEIESGIILSSGNIAHAIGPNDDNGTSQGHGLPGDPDLEGITGYSTLDAATLEFDFECNNPQGFAVRYVFGSEEYHEYAETQFVDAFGFFLNENNVALLPDGVTPVSIDTVNCGMDYPTTTGPNCDLLNSNHDNSHNTEMDAFTVPLSIDATITGGVNHLKISIADGSDHIWDSFIFLEEGSLVCASPTLPPPINNELIVKDPCTTFYTGSEGIEIGTVCTEVDGDHVEVCINITAGMGEEATCCLKETHICNAPSEMLFDISFDNEADCCEQEKKYIFSMHDMHHFMCEEECQMFQLDGHATVLCDEPLLADDVDSGGDKGDQFGPSVGDVQGVNVDYYEGEWSMLPDFSSLSPYKSDTVPNINYPHNGDDFQVFATSTQSQTLGAVFEGQLRFPEQGDWMLCVESDDGSNVYIDETLLINNDGLHGVLEVCANITIVSPDPKHIKVEYFEKHGTASLVLSWKGPDTPKAPIPPSAWYQSVPPIGDVGGVNVIYYDGTWNMLPDFSQESPYKSDTVPNINYPSVGGDFATSGQDETLGAVFEGQVRFPKKGDWTLCANSDDGSKVYVDDTLLINNDGLHGMQEVCASITIVSPGPKDINVEYFEKNGGAGLVLSWTGPDTPKAPIPPSAWYPEGEYCYGAMYWVGFNCGPACE